MRPATGFATRRGVLRALALGGGAAWLTGPLWAAGGAAGSAWRASRALMGTRVDLTLDGAPAVVLQAAAEAAFAQMQRLADLMSRYRPGNPLALLAAAAGRHPVPMPQELLGILKVAQRISEETQGAFDVTVGALAGWQFDKIEWNIPDAQKIQHDLRYVNHRRLILDKPAGTAFLTRAGMQVDLGGVAKLPILQAGMDVLARHGVPAALVNGGGDVIVRGCPAAGPWRIGVRDPAAPRQLLGVLPLQGDAVVASSGDYERCVVRDGRRYHHVLDPSTGYPTAGVHGVTLLGRHVDEVNGLGAAAMVLGPTRGARLLAGGTSGQALLVRQDGGLWLSPTLAQRLQPPPGQVRLRPAG